MQLLVMWTLHVAPTLAILQVLVLSCVSTPGIRYIKPENAINSSCPGQPCLTLDRYIEYQGTFFTAGSTFVFLPGNHSLQSTIYLKSTSNITLRGTGYNSTATLSCTDKFSIVCRNVSALRVEWLTFDMTKNQWLLINNEEDPATVFRVAYCRDVVISNCMFHGSGNISHATVTAIRAAQSNITIYQEPF